MADVASARSSFAGSDYVVYCLAVLIAQRYTDLHQTTGHCHI